MFKQASKINAENKDKGLHSDDDEEPRRLNTGGQKKFPPPQVKTVNVIYATHIPKREWKRALWDVYAMEPVTPSSIHGQLARSLSIEETIRPVSAMADSPHWF